MVREKDSVWAHWESLGINRDGRHYARCRNCQHRLQVNVSRFKLHLVLHCLNLDSSIREQYRPFVASNSLSTPKQKLALSYPITADNGEHCSKSPRGPVFSNSKSPSTSSMPQDLSREQSPNLIEDDDNTDVDNSVYNVKLERSAPTSHGSCKPPPTKKALLTRYRNGLPVHLDQVSADQKEGIHKTRAKARAPTKSDEPDVPQRIFAVRAFNPRKQTLYASRDSSMSPGNPDFPGNGSSDVTDTAQTSVVRTHTGLKACTDVQAVRRYSSNVADDEHMAIQQRKRLREEDEDILNYECESKRVELEERKIALEERKIALEERKMALEHSNAIRTIEVADKLRAAEHKKVMREKQIAMEDVELQIRMAKLKNTRSKQS